MFVYSILEDNYRWLTKVLLLDRESNTVDGSDTLQRFWDIQTHTDSPRMDHHSDGFVP